MKGKFAENLLIFYYLLKQLQGALSYSLKIVIF